MKVRFFLVVLALLVALAAAPREPKEKKEGNCKDNHGDLQWESSASPSAKNDDWNYARSVTNRSKTMRCKIIWENSKSGFKWKSILESEDQQNPGTFSTPIPPEDEDGTMTYDGGKAAGDGSGPAPAWVPLVKQAASSPDFSADADLAFETGDKLHRIHVKGSSSSPKDSPGIMYYRLVVEPTESEVPATYSGARFRWTALAAAPSELDAAIGSVDKTQVVTLKRDKTEKQWEFLAMLKLADKANLKLTGGVVSGD